ncbi:hypothetical protein [Halorientalis salina]|uniref:hypothetical protein n=1 Tax=Halorientalis salina TaxID=2932266 RepID=UPI0010ACFF39|nr:hypothetical protein [Halorientalis salina]
MTSQLHRIGVGLRALAKTGPVVVRRPTVLVYPLLLTLSVTLLIVVLAAPILLIDGQLRWVVWILCVLTYFLGGGVVCAWLFGAMFYEIDGVFRGDSSHPFAGLRVVWRKRRLLTALGLVLGSAGVVIWFARPLLERLLGETPVTVLSALQGSGNLFAILIVTVADCSIRESVESAADAVSATSVESVATSAAIRGISTICLVSGAAFGIGATLTGYQVAPLGFFTPFVGFLLVPVLTVFCCCLLEGVARTAVYRHALDGNAGNAGITSDRMLRTSQGESGK